MNSLIVVLSDDVRGSTIGEWGEDFKLIFDHWWRPSVDLIEFCHERWYDHHHDKLQLA